MNNFGFFEQKLLFQRMRIFNRSQVQNIQWNN